MSVTKSMLGDGYYLTCVEDVPNGVGGYCTTSITLHNDELNFHKEITDRKGYFLEFPGVVEGEWQKNITHIFSPQVQFVTKLFGFDDKGLISFYWMLQPDGWYYADEQGFGAEHDVEIWLLSYIDKEGHFTQPFEYCESLA